ncbi:hypothetical protein CEK26_000385 [Fusarium fujikuroi]|uniref:Uncharacterized protein n=1 Tax=Fusarium fujikuroi TaxID=5127 RepID=A0A5Q3E8Q2_FUSFU|nr:Uncharacterized protein Y057_5879 [Fusarium fujikuroi]KLP17293.1 Uncharacterized protein LW94_8712 [Fusarium fujikuroi]QGI58258.1 hypothetical protein CEK27_000383 [Fusarium fujikuroi]QGI75477.1 hypothetical protein CEK25_000383 [Fusarium fujikuroi]QGI89170.1 hypothetical protein CEK26_000385 [Fusarium fujikuroi]
MRMISHILQNTSWVTNRSHAAAHLLPDARKRPERVGRPKINEQGGFHTHHIYGCPGPDFLSMCRISLIDDKGDGAETQPTIRRNFHVSTLHVKRAPSLRQPDESLSYSFRPKRTLLGALWAAEALQGRRKK